MICPKCKHKVDLRVPLLLCVHGESLPMSDEALVEGIEAGTIHGLGLGLDDVHAVCPKCGFTKKPDQLLVLNLPIEAEKQEATPKPPESDEDKEPPNRLLN